MPRWINAFPIYAMTVQLQRPLLTGGLFLVILVGCLELLSYLLHDGLVYLLFGGAIATGVWWLKRSPSQVSLPASDPKSVDPAAVQRSLTAAEQVISQLQAEAATAAITAEQLPLLQSRLANISVNLDRKDLNVTVLGAKATGKSTLIQYLQSNWVGSSAPLVSLQEACCFTVGVDTDLAGDTLALQQAIAADLAIFLVSGDLTASELAMVRRLATRKRMLLVLSKQDQYLPADRQAIVERLQGYVKDLIAAQDVVAIAANPNPIKVRQHQADGTAAEWMEATEPDLACLIARLTQIVETEAEQLVLASSFNQACSVKQDAADTLNTVRRERALPVIEQYQWISAAAAFASPLPTVDVLATVAVNTQLIIELGKLYQRPLTPAQAKKIATTLGVYLLKLGVVEISTQAIMGLLKTNFVTYLAGGCIQAASAAYLTRIAGLTLVEYFQGQDVLEKTPSLSIASMGQILQRVFRDYQQLSFLQDVVQQVISRFSSPLAQVEVGAQPVPSLPELLPMPLQTDICPLLTPKVQLLEPEPVTMAQNQSSVISLPS